MNEATARIKINRLLEAAGWRFFADGNQPANICLEPSITIKASDLDALGDDFDQTARGFIDFLLLDAKGFPLIVLEAKSEDKNPLVGKEQARKYARSQNCRFIILSNGNLHYFWDLERGNPYTITLFPTPDSVDGYQKVTPNPQRLIDERVDDDYIVLTQRPGYASETAWKNEAERPAFIQANTLRFLRPYQLQAVHALQRAVQDGSDRFLFEMATGTGKTLTAAAVIKLFLRSGNALAKKTDRIAFFKVENDGFDLGAQRRPIDKDDLPQARAEITEYLRRLRAGESVADFHPTLGLILEKEKVTEGDYNLSGERYRPNATRVSSYPMVPIGEICDLINGRAFKPADWKDSDSGGLPIVRIQNLNTPDSGFNYYTGEIRERHVIDGGQLLFSWSGSRGTSFGAHIWNGGKAVLNQHIFKVGFDKTRITKMYLFHALNKAVAQVEENLHGGVGLVHITKGNLERIQIPLPPLEVQQEIVVEIEGYQKVIDGARAVVDNYRPHIPIDPDWPMVELGEVCKRLQYGLSTRLNTEETGYKTFRMNELVDGRCVDFGYMKCVDISAREFTKYRLVPGDILFNRTNSFEHVGRTGIFDLDGDYCFASYLIRLSVSEDAAHPLYVNAFMNTEGFQAGIKQYATRAIGQSNINAKSLAAYRIPLPPLPTQRAIVAEIEAEQALVNANRELIERFEKKIRTVVERVWGN